MNSLWTSIQKAIDDKTLQILCVDPSNSGMSAALVTECDLSGTGPAAVEVAYLDDVRTPASGLAAHTRTYGYLGERSLWPAEWLASFVGRFAPLELRERHERGGENLFPAIEFQVRRVVSPVPGVATDVAIIDHAHLPFSFAEVGLPGPRYGTSLLASWNVDIAYHMSSVRWMTSELVRVHADFASGESPEPQR